MRNILRSTGFWLAVQMIALGGWLAASGTLTLQMSLDSQVYLETSRQPLGKMLLAERTVGYPLVLRAVALVSPDYRLLPLVQLAAHFLATAAFYRSLRSFGAAPWPALAAGSAVLWVILDPHIGINWLLTDPLGRSFAVATVASLLWVTALPDRRWPWLLFAVALAATYHVRPAYLFLVPLAPCLGMLLLRLRETCLECHPPWIRVAAGLIAAAGVPLLAWCGVRFLAVGHFGLVSFGGYNMIGHAAELIDETTLEKLPEPYRPLARAIYAERRRRGLIAETPNYYRWSEHYNTNVWRVAVPQAQRLYGDDAVAVNDRLAGLSWALVRLRPRVYFQYVRFLARQGLKEFLESRVLTGAIALMLLLYFLRLLIDPHAEGAVSAAFVRHAVIWVALSFALAKLLLVILVEPPIARYVEAAGVFLPAVAALVAVDELSRILAALHRRRRPVPVMDASESGC